jgi:hypothetical protein
MSKEANQIKKRYYPLRDVKNPDKVSLVEITEAQYRALYPEIWATQKREQHHHRCMCTRKYLWKCDGNCDLCEYHAAGDILSLDVPTEDGNANLYDTIPDTAPTMEDVLSDAMLLEQLIARFRELDLDADRIIELLRYELSDRKIAEQLGRKQRTFADQMKKIRTELRKIRGY